MINSKTGKIAGDYSKKSPKLLHVSGLQILDNDQVNFISSFLTSLIVSAIVYLWLS
jgi:uncharacterized membrane protein